MVVQFCPAVLPSDLRRLIAFDHKVFPRSDWFWRSDWERYESYWMLVNGKRVGCCAFEHNADFREDLEEQTPPRKGSLYVASTGILPRDQGKGWGDLMKCWQIAYARQQGFARIVTNVRKSNRPMIRLNTKFGFKILRTSKLDYYAQPAEPTIVMELKLPSRTNLALARVRKRPLTPRRGE